MDKSGQDALAETLDVVSGLRQYLSAVGKFTQQTTQDNLWEIEQRLKSVENEIISIRRLTRPH